MKGVLFGDVSAHIGRILLKLLSFLSDVNNVSLDAIGQKWRPYYMQNKGHFPLYLIFNRRNFLRNSSCVGWRGARGSAVGRGTS